MVNRWGNNGNSYRLYFGGCSKIFAYGDWSHETERYLFLEGQAPPSMGFSRQEYWRGLPCPPPGDLPDPGIKPMSLMSPVLAGEIGRAHV